MKSAKFQNEKIGTPNNHDRTPNIEVSVGQLQFCALPPTQNDLSRPGAGKPGTRQDLESTLQERSHPVVWLVFHAVALWSATSFWLRFRRICAWHLPKPRRMGGNPIARRVTHGMCPECFARVSAEIISHGETDLRVSVTKARHTGGPSLLAPPARNCAVPARLQRPSAGDPDTTRPAVLRGKSF